MLLGSHRHRLAIHPAPGPPGASQQRGNEAPIDRWNAEQEPRRGQSECHWQPGTGARVQMCSAALMSGLQHLETGTQIAVGCNAVAQAAKGLSNRTGPGSTIVKKRGRAGTR